MSRRLGYHHTPNNARRRTRHRFLAAFVGGFVVGFVLAWFTLAAWGDPILDGVKSAWDSVAGPPPTEQEVRDRYREVISRDGGLDDLPIGGLWVCPDGPVGYNLDNTFRQLRDDYPDLHNPSLVGDLTDPSIEDLLALDDTDRAMAYLDDVVGEIDKSEGPDCW